MKIGNAMIVSTIWITNAALLAKCGAAEILAAYGILGAALALGVMLYDRD